MSLRLRLLSIYTPKFLLRKELDELDLRTTAALQELLKEENSEAGELKMKAGDGSLEKKREEMARTHNQLVQELIKVMGRQNAIERGRERLFRVGKEIGEMAGKRLGVSSGLEDMIRAARIMYKVLGIEFNVLRDEEGTKLMVYQCALSQYYSPDACQILSAADEGVVQGLNPRLKMRFVERMTSGQKNCVARIDASEIKEVGG